MEMTIEEKRNKLKKYCDGRSCGECSIREKNIEHKCGRGSHYSLENSVADEEIIKNYNIAFGDLFSKDDLKVGYLVELRNGDLCQLIQLENKIGLFTKDESYVSDLMSYSDNLLIDDNYNKEYDIIKVYGYTGGGSLYNTEKRELLWERDENEQNTKEYHINSQFHDIKILPNGSMGYNDGSQDYKVAVEIVDDCDNVTFGLSVDGMKDMIVAFQEIIDCIEGDK